MVWGIVLVLLVAVVVVVVVLVVVVSRVSRLGTASPVPFKALLLAVVAAVIASKDCLLKFEAVFMCILVVFLLVFSDEELLVAFE